jgi:hypothetical protein
MAIATLAEAKTQYLANASYDADGSRPKAFLFIEACRALLMLRPSATNRGEFGIDFESLNEERKLAQQWLAANPGTARATARFADFDNFRDHR